MHKPYKLGSEYIEKTKDLEPRPWLVKALVLVDQKNEALDLGPGALIDTKYLIEQGFKHVTAVDSSNTAQEIYETLPSGKVDYVTSSFENFSFPEDTYDLINAQFSLPFNPKETFPEVFDKVKKSLKEGGIFVGQLFGTRDDWSKIRDDATFLTKEQATALLSDLTIIEFEEEEKDSIPAVGEFKHWHIFNIIAKK